MAPKSFKLVSNFDSADLADQYIDEHHHMYASHSNNTNCTLCLVNLDQHKMNVRYFKCATKECAEIGECQFQYKMRTCKLKNNSRLEFLGGHLSAEFDRTKSQRGLSTANKTLVNQIMKLH